MQKDDLIVRIAGAAGDGVQSSGFMVAKFFQRIGLYVFTYNYYQDIIRGGWSWYQIRASEKKVKNQGDGLDILIALNAKELKRHMDENINEGGASPLSKNGIAIFDSDIKIDFKDDRIKAIPLSRLAREYSKNPIVKNTVALGAMLKAINMDLDTMYSVIDDTFGKKGDVTTENKNALKAGYDAYNYEKLNMNFEKRERKGYLIAGGEAVGLGAVMGGMKAYFAYPMTPASSALHWLANHAIKYKILVKVVEDEISAINMAIGANYAGIRAMAGTSGGGFALMTEAVGMSGMMEIPLVIYEAQRAGPSTGLPTKTEQGDLFQVLGASQGDFPRIIFAPRNVSDAFYCTREAFNVAEKYQLPVIVMSDLYLAEHAETVEDLDFNFKIDRGKIIDKKIDDYKRYEYTPDGISFRAFPGTEGLMHNEDSDEHDEYGDVISDAVTDPSKRMKSMEKRMRKLETYIKEMPPTPTYRLDDADFVVFQWGSTQGVVEEAIDMLRDDGLRIGAIEINRVFPLNPDIKKILGERKFVVVENNFTGQFARLLKETFLINPEAVIRKYDGEAFYPKQVYKEIKNIFSEVV